MKFLILFVVLSELHASEARSFRLPTTVEPSFYAIQVRPDLDEGTFKGEVTILARVKTPITSITFHSCNINITEIYLNGNKNVSYVLDPVLEFIDVFFDNNSTIPSGDYVIHVTYTGSLLTPFRGFFRAKFSNENQTSYLAVTDFQPTHARKAFPCFDEPSFKAQFEVTVIAPNSTYKVLSNTKKIAKVENSTGVWHKFETSPVMSTYLVAFAVAPYSYGELTFDYGGRDLPIRVYSLNANNEVNAEPLQIVKKSLNFLTSYTNFSYPLAKIDLIEYDRALSGATENWGLVTARKGLLSPKLELFGPLQIFTVMAHETSHFWFGNLVTNNWWDDIWLQEGFAVFMAVKIEEFVRNTSSVKFFPQDFMKKSYYYDLTNRSKPIVSTVTKPENIAESFNDLAYTKGAVVLRMVENVIGENKFQIAIQNYIKMFAYKTATTNDLITIFENLEPNLPLRSFIESFVYQNRYPLLQVDEDEEAFVITQISSAFRKNDSGSVFQYKWTIPLTYVSDVDKERKLTWFSNDTDSVLVPKGGKEWIILNYNQVGFYLSSYSDTLWTKFGNTCKELEPYARMRLLQEAIQLYTLDISSCDHALTFIEKLSAGDKPIVPPFTIARLYSYSLEQNMAKYDESAFEILETYLQMVLRRGNYTEKLSVIRDSSYVQFNEEEEVAETVSLCSQWIKENLPKYLEQPEK